MDIVDKIARDEKKVLDKILSRYPGEKHTIGATYFKGGLSMFHKPSVKVSSLYRGLDKEIGKNKNDAMALLRVEAQKCYELRIINRATMWKVFKMLKGDEEMVGLAKAMINGFRNNRLKQQRKQ